MSLKHVVHKRVHLERPQPASRQRLGYLEKHKDYIKRAQDFHRKEDILKRLHRKAYFKNEDEFDPAMVNFQVREGKAVKKAQHLSKDEAKLLDSQDATYVGYRERLDINIAAEAMESLHFLDAEKPNKHVIFADEDDLQVGGASGSSSGGKGTRKLKDFDVAAYFDTHPALVCKKSNRPRMKQLETAAFVDREDIEDEVRRAYTKLISRQDRAKSLRRVREELELRNHLRQKGRRMKVADAEKGRPASYKWLPQRKK